MKQNKNRPYVVCHILSALDGNISGSYFMMPELQPVQEAFARIRADYQCDAYLAGAVTAASIYADGFLDEEEIEELEAARIYPRETYVADPQAQHYAVIIDTEGSLRWNKGHIKRAGMPELHMIEILTENVSDGYLAMLRRAGISYLFAGKERLDIGRLLETLKKEFGVNSLMITGGGVVDWSFLQAGAIDELSLVLSPLAGGETDKATVFDRSDYLAENVPAAFSLLDVRKVEGDGIWLRYVPKNRR